MGHKFNPEHIEKLLRKERAEEFPPDKFLADGGLAEGARLADVGCGPGFFTLPASEIVGPGGRVYAIDTQAEMLDELRKRNPPDNVELVLSDESSIPLEDGAADMALLSFVLHEAEEAVRFLIEIKRILRSGGRLLVLDWKKQHEEHGPPYEERLTEQEASSLLEEAGFSGVEALAVTASHYRVTGEKP